jgi:hypothetical protein
MNIQYASLFWFDFRFGSIEADLSFGQEMAENGVPSDQRYYMMTALRRMESNVSEYVRSLGLWLITLNAATLALLFAGGRRGS